MVGSILLHMSTLEHPMRRQHLPSIAAHHGLIRVPDRDHHHETQMRTRSISLRCLIENVPRDPEVPAKKDHSSPELGVTFFTLASVSVLAAEDNLENRLRTSQTDDCDYSAIYLYPWAISQHHNHSAS
nr:hypothetical protein CFP56_13437 [Quercus suber]